MGIVSIALLLVLVIYVVFIAQLILGFAKIKYFETTNLTPKTAFTIVVPFRNEEKNLNKLLESFSQLNYPISLIQIVMVDDFSKDNSVKIYNQWRLNHEAVDTTLLENLELSYSPKKDALTRAIPIAKHDWIVTTDADCLVDANWLLTLDNYIQENNPEMIIGAVIYKTKNNWFHHFQQLDLMSLQGTTIGSFGIGKPFMCNGANFAYTKRFFNEIGGFGGISDKASGDDVLLLQKAVKSNLEKVHYLKNNDVIVKTKPENDLFKLFMQRVRWAGKTTSYDSSYAKMLAVFVLLMNLGLVCGLWFAVCDYLDWKIFQSIFLVKYVVDYILLYQSNSYLRKGKFFVPIASSLIYPFFSSLVGIYSLFGSFRWKGRKFKK
ncbi:glycosyltransferase [Flavobacterium wongokense]|uniref:glycosyltransferase n=1 Tax=Flavobacterium wongokense TaxID=2910674 RepID=UPI001F432D9C|nr:glycosyltransferase [Flavobacterium sp. WG47]MCF6131123.1 glycosyltransferase [Flavobacterium sp. WG47]